MEVRRLYGLEIQANRSVADCNSFDLQRPRYSRSKEMSTSLLANLVRVTCRNSILFFIREHMGIFWRAEKAENCPPPKARRGKNQEKRQGLVEVLEVG